MDQDHHLRSADEVAEALRTSPSGLDDRAVRERLEQHGRNEIESAKSRTIWRMIWDQVTDFMILILIAAAVVSGWVGDTTDTIVILAIVVLNATVGIIQEWRAERAIEALREMAASNARVVRNGDSQEIPAADLVPGDVVNVEAGNVVPADVRLFEVHTLKVDESSLTGESVDVEKDPEPLPPGDYALGDRSDMAYKGTYVTHGRGVGYVVATGMKTELGKIARMIQTEGTKTPLQRKLGVFGKQLTVIILVLCALFFFVGWQRGESLSTMLLTSISLAVAAIPEALPALVTVALALGAKRLVKTNALIRKLPAVETLGAVTYICSDKTGTLTLNQMTVETMYEHQPISTFNEKDGSLLYAIGLNNDVTRDKEGHWVGDSTEVALAKYAQEHNLSRPDLEKKYKRVAELPFDSRRKMMTTIHRTPSGVVAIVKGAVDVLLSKLAGAEGGEAHKIEEKVNEMASQGYRTLGYAVRTLPDLPKDLDAGHVETELTFAGIAGMIDPPREEAEKSVSECRAAGIIPVMITGDHKLTARAIAEKLGIITSPDDEAIDGPELEKMSDSDFEQRVEHIRVYARVNPEQKLRIINSLQKKHHFVAMTGDGVNDAPALKNADIGIAMGINGTEVSKEAAHMILLDDNFSTIVLAVKHGRRIFDNILKFIRYIMTGNSGEIWAIMLAPFLGLPIPLLAIHILWVNLVSDGLPGLALASERSEPNIMSRPPRDPKENIFAGGLGWHILVIGLLIGLATVGTQAWAIHHGVEHWQTIVFTVLCFSQLFHVVAIRSSERSLFTIGMLSNKPMLVALVVTILLQLMIIYVPFFNEVFKTQPLTVTELLAVVAISSVTFWAVELEKLFRRRVSQRRQTSEPMR